ncbi:hypothetical protein N802_05160 [Knoellia sinensis KCTC 19936]|uniref:Uncharacterized protein n=1 Tax=Knoellia sinensis KCTC 19936 TaxID=1385520 RepID=A0A0A0J2U8_9MICO|nr:hypothetical protein [Knoellia sinensis]KGN30994.1 hypothetical protein N802_05160 [Knoellia sinensis KCTC 19936]
MNQLHDLLDTASRPAAPDGRDTGHDVTSDIRLGRRVLRRRRLAAAGGGVAAAGLVAGALVGGAALSGGPGPTGGPALPGGGTSASVQTNSAPVTLTDTPAQAGAFHFSKTPTGWVAGASGPYAGLLVPVSGGVSDDETDFAGKITAMVQNRSTAGGAAAVHGSGLTFERSITLDGMEKTLVVQIPDSVRLSPDDVGSFVAAITVSPAVQSAAG